jgi:2-C-methyl-D-erythritol 4-phosphate cytidylyltransferase
MNQKSWGIIVASGKGEKFTGDIDTSFLSLGSKPVLTYSLTAFEQCADVDYLLLVVPKERIESVRVMVQMFGGYKVKKIVAGTTQRQTSVQAGLKALKDEDVSIVTVHDASRPCVTAAQISETIKAAKRYGSGVLATRVFDSVKQVDKGTLVAEALDGTKLWAAHTPQSFKFDLFSKAVDAAQKKKAVLADDSEAMTLARKDVHLVLSEKPVVKISGPLDINLAEFFLRH